MIFGKALAIEIKYAGLSKSEFARRIGVTKKTVFLWLNGSHIPSMYYLEKMSEVLDCSLEHLLGYF